MNTALSNPATLTVEGEDIEPQVVITRANGLSGGWNVQAFGEANQHYVLKQSTNLTSGFAPRQPEFVADSSTVTVQASESSMMYFRAARAGDMGQRCIANQRRVDFAKEAWGVSYGQPRGAAVEIATVDLFLEGTEIRCSLGGGFYYSALGNAAGCTHPQHSR